MDLIPERVSTGTVCIGIGARLRCERTQDEGSNLTADGCVHHDGHCCDMQPSAWSAHRCCSTWVQWEGKMSISLRTK